VNESDILEGPLCVLSIDPGQSGAVCRLGRGRLDVLRDFKTGADIARAVRDLAGGVSHAIMELVSAMPGQGVCSMFSFGRAAGAADGALALALPADVIVEEVAPQKWQNFFRELLQIPKEVDFDSREIAAKLLPASRPFLERKKDHNTGDALLLACWKILNPMVAPSRLLGEKPKRARRRPRAD